jgi:hypothetical protein
MAMWRAIDPSPEALVAALEQAVRDANAGVPEAKQLFFGSQARVGFSCAVMEVREGARPWCGSVQEDNQHYARVDAAWWTDALGRRHWRVRGSPFGREADRDVPAHPLLAIAGVRAALVERPGKPPALVGFCDCGEYGPVEALAWTGDCCGPCHDRRLDGLPPARGCLPVCLASSGGQGVLAFSPDGRWLLGGLSENGGPQILTRWDLIGGHHETLTPSLPWGDEGTRPPEGVAFLPDSTLVTWHKYDEHDAVIWWDCSRGRERTRHLLIPENQFRDRAAALAPDGTLLAGVAGELALLDCSQPPGAEGPPVRARLALPRTVGGWAFSGPWAFYSNEWRVVNLQTGQEYRAPPPRGQWAMALAGAANSPLFAVVLAGGGIHLFDPVSRSWAELAMRLRIQGLAFSWDGRWLAAGQLGAITVWDVLAREQILTLHLAIGYADALTFSPDGERLAVGRDFSFIDSPLCVLPWRRLLAI